MIPLHKHTLLLAAAAFALTLAPGQLPAVNEKGDWPWNLKLHGHHDAEVAEALGTGWFLNVGPTGIRAQITHDHPKYFTVRYVFKKSPAHGKIAINDIIVGANGKRMNVAHYFGRGSRGRGTWEGPMVEMSKLIEDSQGTDGKLELIVWPGGDRQKETTVPIQIEPIGRFSPTWPYNCKRSDKLMLDLCEFLYQEHKREGKFGRPHANSAAVLALMASNDRKYERLAFDIVKSYAGNRYDPLNGTGYQAWNWGHESILLGEYYLLTKDRRVLPAIESLVSCVTYAQTPESGGFSHRPSPYIMRRQASGGPKGYGAMALPGGLTMLGLSLFKEADLDYGQDAYERIHQAYLRSVNGSGSIGYGFEGLDHAVITLTGPNATKSGAKRGIGFEIESGMTNIGPFEINWPTKSDPRYKPTDWLTKEASTNRVFDFGEAKRLVVRTMPAEEPKRPYKHDGGRIDHLARSGTGALAHAIGNRDNKSWNYLADHMATGCAKSPESLLDGHASTHMHVIWGSLGAALADEKDFRAYMEGIKWWFIMAQAHDGGFVVLPGRDYASTDHVYGTRVFPTGCAAVILALKEKRLRITGAGSGTAPPPAAAFRTPTTPSSQPEAAPAPPPVITRPPREITPDRLAQLAKDLHVTLVEIGLSGEPDPLPMDLSKAHAKVRFAGVDNKGQLVFSALAGDTRATFPFDDLSPADHALLARLAARLLPDDPVAQCIAGAFMETTGRTDLADKYYETAGPTAPNIIKDWFR